MTKEELDKIACAVENDGFDYAFRQYMSPDFGDEQFKFLYNNYLSSSKELIKYIKKEAKRLKYDLDVEF